MPTEHKSQTLEDFLSVFPDGMNSGLAPVLLQRTQLAKAVNGTVRGAYITHRPSFQKRTLIFMDTGIQTALETGLWQGACHYKPDNGVASLMASVSGNLYQFEILGNQVSVYLRSGAGTTQSTTAAKCWLWQSEKWVIWNDGISNPVFFDGSTSRRSNWNTPVKYATDTSASFVVPAIAATVVVSLTSVTNLLVGDLVMIKTAGHFMVQSIAGLNVTFVNFDSTFVGQTIPSGTPVWWSHQGTELPPGRMGAYGMGRNWGSLVDGKQFVAGDLVGGSSGTQAESFRDAVLNVTENIYLAGGGNFTVPGSVGDIRAMKFVATLDTSLGQGPMQVLTSNTVFSCNAPVDRLTWQDITNPILTESMIGTGGTGQNSTVNANSDLIFRSPEGLQSLIMARAQFGTWGNVPMSREVQEWLDRDNPSLLSYGTSAVFNNRLIIGTGPIQHQQGVYHAGMVALNFDPVSSLRGKAPSVYDGLWTGMNTFQFVVGDFQDVKRCFAFTLNIPESKIELWELIRDVDAHVDNTDTQITWAFETPVLFGPQVNRGNDLLELEDGEIYVDDLKGDVNFFVYYKPDSWPCWIPWNTFPVCSKEPVATDPNTANYKPAYVPRIGFGRPSADFCDEFNNKPLRRARNFQIKVVITGSCKVVRIGLRAFTVPETMFAKQLCDPICP